MQTEIERIAHNLVRNEVHLCLSSMVATLAQGGNQIDYNRHASGDLASLSEQAADLCAPLDDWEEAAIQHGAEIVFRDTDQAWIVKGTDHWSQESASAVARAYCELDDIEPHQSEIFEHWAVSQRLAEDLAELGERVDTDFAGLCVWGRTTTGQMIEMDSVIQRVAQLVHDRAKAITEEVA